MRAFCPEGRHLAPGDGLDGIIVFDTQTGAREEHLAKTYAGIVIAVAFAPDGRSEELPCLLA